MFFCKRLLLILLVSIAAAYSPGRDVEGVILPFKEVLVSASIPGIIQTIHVDEGDRVAAGQALVDFERREEELQARRLEQVLRKRRFDYEGMERLFGESMTSETEKLEKEIELRVAEIDYEQARNELSRRTVASPLGGVVVRRFHEVGEWAEAGQPLFELVNTDKVFVRLLLKAVEARQLSPGDEVTLSAELLAGHGPFTGRIDFIDPRIDASSGLMRVKILVDNPHDILRPGMRVVVHLKD